MAEPNSFFLEPLPRIELGFFPYQGKVLPINYGGMAESRGPDPHTRRYHSFSRRGLSPDKFTLQILTNILL